MCVAQRPLCFSASAATDFRRLEACATPQLALFPKPECAILVRVYRTQDLHVKEIVRLLTPNELKAQSPTTGAANATVARSREQVVRILRQKDPRLLGYLCTTWGKVEIPQAAEWPPVMQVLHDWE